MLTVGSLFAGIGGFDLGFERAGMRTLWQVEQSEFCRRVLERHFPDAERYVDVQHVGAGNHRWALEPVDLICGGFPCQDLSYAGKGAGLEGERSGLWSEYARIVGELRPRYVVVENVSALLGRGLGRVLGDLAEVGYDAEWDCIPASAVGAPHQRDRVWIVAYPQGERGSRFAGLGAAGGPLVGTEPRPGRRDSGRGSSEGIRQLGPSAGGGAGRSAEAERHPDADGSGRGPGARLADVCEGEPDAEGRRPRRAGEDLADTHEERRDGWPWELGQERWREPSDGSWWAAEPPVGRVAHGIPARVDRLAALGNALVPQIAEWIGRRIIEWEGDVK